MSELKHGRALQYFGDYLLLGEIASGGMGVVYCARHVPLNRTVALKMIRSGQFARPEEIERFRIEAEAAANLVHPNIVPIYEVGQHEGQPYFSMQYVKGWSLAEQIAEGLWRIDDTNKVGLQRRMAGLIGKVARAVHHAHQRGILHRDLKPANILLDEQQEPHLTDFGLAKLLDRGYEQTQSLATLGTPGYMAPEQAAGKSKHVTTDSDTYSLGAVLFELLTGQRPFGGETPAETIQLVLQREPPRPSALNPAIDTELEAICLKCLEKEPARRYHSAEALAKDLQSWLGGEPILARPVTPLERALKWARRNPVVASLTATVMLMFVVGFVGVTSQWQRAEHQRRETQEANVRLLLKRAEDHFTTDNAHLALASLARLLRDQPANRAAAERLLHALDQRVFLLPSTTSPRTPRRDEAGIPKSELGLSPDGKLRVSGLGTTNITLSEATTSRILFVISNAHAQVIRDVRFSPNGTRILSASADQRAVVWDTATCSPVLTLPHADAVYHAEFNPDGTRIVTASFDGAARLWDSGTGQHIGDAMRHLKPVNTARFSPDGQFIVTASEDSTIRVWDAKSALAYSEPAHLTNAVAEARFSRDGRHVIAKLTDGGAVHSFFITQRTAFQFASAEETDSAQPSSPPTEGTRLAILKQKIAARRAERILSLDLSPDATLLVVGYADNTARLWDTRRPVPVGEPLVHAAKVNCARFSPDGRRLATSTAHRHVRVWDVKTCQPLSEWIIWPDTESGVTGVRFSLNGDWLILSTGAKVGIHRMEGAAPPWLPDLAEYVAGTRFAVGDLSEAAPAETFAVTKATLLRTNAHDRLTQWVKAFLAGETP